MADAHPRVIDENVDPAESRNRGIDHALHVLCIGEIKEPEFRAAERIVLAAAGGNRRQFLARAVRHQVDRRPSLGEGERNGPADPARCPGN